MRRGPLFLAALSACVSAEYSFMALPERSAGTKSLVAVIERDNSVEVIAAESASARIESDRDGLFRITLLGYEKSLEQLGLTAGPLDLSDSETCGARALPGAQLSWVAEVGSSDLGFVASVQLPPVVEAVRLRVACPCVELRQLAEVELDTTTDAYSVLPYDERRVVVRSDKSYLLNVDGEIEGRSTEPGLLLTSGYRTPEGEVWYGSASNHLARGPWDALVTTPLEVTMDSTWIDGSHRPGTPLEIYILSFDGVLSHFDGVTQRVLWDLPSANSMQEGALATAAPGEVVASQKGGLGLLSYRSGAGVINDPWPIERGQVAGIDYVGDPYGVVIGTKTAQVFVGSGGAWRALQRRTPAEFEGALRGFTAFRGGMIGVGDSSLIVQHHPDAGFCRPELVNTGINFHEVVVLGDRIFIAGNPNRDGPSLRMSTVLILEPAG